LTILVRHVHFAAKFPTTGWLHSIANWIARAGAVDDWTADAKCRSALIAGEFRVRPHWRPTQSAWLRSVRADHQRAGSKSRRQILRTCVGRRFSGCGL